jgi:hypothetical protein
VRHRKVLGASGPINQWGEIESVRASWRRSTIVRTTLRDTAISGQSVCDRRHSWPRTLRKLDLRG